MCSLPINIPWNKFLWEYVLIIFTYVHLKIYVCIFIHITCNHVKTYTCSSIHRHSSTYKHLSECLREGIAIFFSFSWTFINFTDAIFSSCPRRLGSAGNYVCCFRCCRVCVLCVRRVDVLYIILLTNIIISLR